MDVLEDRKYSKKTAGITWGIRFVLLVLMAVLLFFTNLGNPDFWSDEILSQVKFASFVDNLKQIATDIHPPLYSMLSWG